MTRVRHARAADLRHLAAIEASGGPLFEQHLGDPLAGDVPTGAARAGEPGFLLVAGEVGEPVGFAHVRYLDGWAHLEQLSVRPEHGRRGVGTALVEAACEEARWAGHDELSLCTYRDVPFNGPFYARLGFVVAERLEAYQERIRAAERAAGLDRLGPRVVMTKRLVRG